MTESESEKFKTKNAASRGGFTLVELMIVVSILGILAAIVLPEFQDHIQQAREAQAKANLAILRGAIERYAAEHGVPPGYLNDDMTQSPMGGRLVIQLAQNKDYVSKMPKNPFNDKSSVAILANTAVISESVAGVFGWLYKPTTKEIWLDTPGTDSQGRRYYEY